MSRPGGLAEGAAHGELDVVGVGAEGQKSTAVPCERRGFFHCPWTSVSGDYSPKAVLCEVLREVPLQGVDKIGAVLVEEIAG